MKKYIIIHYLNIISNTYLNRSTNLLKMYLKRFEALVLNFSLTFLSYLIFFLLLCLDFVK